MSETVENAPAKPIEMKVKKQNKKKKAGVLILKKNPKHAVRAAVECDSRLRAVYDVKYQVNFKLPWSIGWVDRMDAELYKKMQPHHKVNHLPGVEQLSRKKSLALNLNNLKQDFPQEYDFYPQTWVLPQESHLLKAYFDKRKPSSQVNKEADKKSRYESNVVIIKPDAMAEGSGIYFATKFDDIKTEEHVVVQSYLRPFLIEQKKFDMRVYVLVTGVEPLTVHMFNNGLARFCTEDYVESVASGEDAVSDDAYKRANLTNYTVNKENPNVEKETAAEQSEESFTGCKRSLRQLNEYLKKQGHNVDALWSEIGDIIVKSLVTVQPIMSHSYRLSFPRDLTGGPCFQLLGYDILLDADLRPWLIEVNRNPSLACDWEIDRTIKHALITDIMTILDPQLPAPKVSMAQKMAALKAAKDQPKVSKQEQRKQGVNKRIERERELTKQTGFIMVHPPPPPSEEGQQRQGPGYDEFVKASQKYSRGHAYLHRDKS